MADNRVIQELNKLNTSVDGIKSDLAGITGKNFGSIKEYIPAIREIKENSKQIVIENVSGGDVKKSNFDSFRNRLNFNPEYVFVGLKISNNWILPEVALCIYEKGTFLKFTVEYSGLVLTQRTQNMKPNDSLVRFNTGEITSYTWIAF